MSSTKKDNVSLGLQKAYQIIWIIVGILTIIFTLLGIQFFLEA